MIYTEEKDKETKKDKEIKKEKKKRCFYCKKRLKLLEENLCKCGKIFCPKHRLCHSHNCPLIKSEDHKKKIEKNNPKIQNDKVDKI
tara:strand:- start:421 stop:678 length:258 start_codon:yes stop_codon:yes gene_type:complete